MNKNIQQVVKGGFQHIWHASITETIQENGRIKEEIVMCHCGRNTNHTKQIFAWEKVHHNKLRRNAK